MFCLTRGDYCTEVSRKDTHAQHERRWNGVHLASRQVGVSEDPQRPQVSIACDSALFIIYKVLVKQNGSNWNCVCEHGTNHGRRTWTLGVTSRTLLNFIKQANIVLFWPYRKTSNIKEVNNTIGGRQKKLRKTIGHTVLTVCVF